MQKKNPLIYLLFGLSLLFLTAALFLLPLFMSYVKSGGRTQGERIVLTVEDVARDAKDDTAALIRTVIRNETDRPFDRVEGELALYRGDVLLYSCTCSYEGDIPQGGSHQVTFRVDRAQQILSCPAEEILYTWRTSYARFYSAEGFQGVFFLNENRMDWVAFTWPILAAGALLAGGSALFLRLRQNKNAAVAEAEDLPGSGSPAEEADAVPSSDGGARSPSSLGGTGSDCSFGSPHTVSGSTAGGSYSAGPAASLAGDRSRGSASFVPVDEDALRSAQRQLDSDSFRAAGYRTAGMTQNAELAEHHTREAFGKVLRAGAGLSGEDLDKFESARSSYESASRMEASYRAGGSRENAESARHRREVAYGGMLRAIAERDGRRSDEFNSARNSFEYASREASSYRAHGQTANAAEAEHRMHLAYGNMMKNLSDLDSRASWEFSSARQSYESASRNAASYRRQGLDKDAERAEHQMRMAEADMLKARADARGGSREFEDARRDYESASRQYYQYKNQGLQSDANRQKDYMDRAYARMMRYI
ncbi:MAG: hypothetical protein ILP12_00940 [Lachnospiraceae bacterium]|nr:hypothetical protein [Lachnospiraceae bacterium]